MPDSSRSARFLLLAALALAPASLAEEQSLFRLDKLPIELPRGISAEALLDRIAPARTGSHPRLRFVQPWPGNPHRHLVMVELDPASGSWNGMGRRPLLVSFTILEHRAPGDLPRIVASSPRPFDLDPMTGEIGMDESFLSELSITFDDWRIRPGVATFTLHSRLASNYAGGDDVAHSGACLFAVVGTSVLDLLAMTESMHDVSASRFDGVLEISGSRWEQDSYTVLPSATRGFHDIRRIRSASESRRSDSPEGFDRSETVDTIDYRWDRVARRYVPALEWSDPLADDPDCRSLVSARLAGRYGDSVDSVVDIDGNVYPAIAIGGRLWMVENLRVTRYNDGTPIPRSPAPRAGKPRRPGSAKPHFQWESDDSLTGAGLGARYGWEAVRTGRLAPEGWHVATDSDWNSLIAAAGGLDSAAFQLRDLGILFGADALTGEILETPRSRDEESVPSQCSRGDLPIGAWWSSTASGQAKAWSYHVTHCDRAVARHASSRANLFQVRCVKD